MTRVLWLTDIHLNFLKPVPLEKFYQQIKDAQPDCVLISGDIGEAPRLKYDLQQLESRLPYPIYFVLGNHDYYGASFEDVESLLREITDCSPRLHWLTVGWCSRTRTRCGLDWSRWLGRWTLWQLCDIPHHAQ